MQIKNVNDAEILKTSEGFMRPLIFGERLMAFHLEIPARFKVKPHAHEGEGFLYCISGELKVISSEGKVDVGSGIAMLVPSGLEVGVENMQDEPVEAIIVGSPPMVKSVEELKELIKEYESKK